MRIVHIALLCTPIVLQPWTWPWWQWSLWLAETKLPIDANNVSLICPGHLIVVHGHNREQIDCSFDSCELTMQNCWLLMTVGDPVANHIRQSRKWLQGDSLDCTSVAFQLFQLWLVRLDWQWRFSFKDHYDLNDLANVHMHYVIPYAINREVYPWPWWM
jgi:hypothetical protein